MDSTDGGEALQRYAPLCVWLTSTYVDFVTHHLNDFFLIRKSLCKDSDNFN